MKFVGIEKKEQGKFITRYDVKYETVDGILKNYEMISRNGDITDFEGLHGKAADAVVIIATDENDKKTNDVLFPMRKQDVFLSRALSEVISSLVRTIQVHLANQR